MIYHYTSALHLPHILADGALRPGRSTQGGFPKPDFLWATTNGAGDPTVTFYDAYRAGRIAMVRFGLDPSTFFPWAEARERNPAWTEDHVRRLEERARGASPAEWRCSMEPYPMEEVQSLSIRTYTGRWAPALLKDLREFADG